MQENGVDFAALEVSSHGLTQQRVAGLNFRVAVLTNLTQDHLDYHGSMADYFAAKRQLFVGHDIEAALINIDDDYGRRLAADSAVNTNVITYGQSEQAAVRYSAVQMQARGMQAWLDTPWGNGLLVLPLIGEFNLANATAAIAALALQGFDFKQLLAAAQKLEPVAGRMELYVKDDAPLAV
ncbi:MAG: UDP-N-acetylmuramoylalanyl-D-glutamate--2,6-diaminopimelate ligase, partial [Thalassolituus sp. CG17_big_fil_post_rev_8_21_14_2_50_53_8]